VAGSASDEVVELVLTVAEINDIELSSDPWATMTELTELVDERLLDMVTDVELYALETLEMPELDWPLDVVPVAPIPGPSTEDCGVPELSETEDSAVLL